MEGVGRKLLMAFLKISIVADTVIYGSQGKPLIALGDIDIITMTSK